MNKKLVLLASIGALAFGVSAQAATCNTRGIGPAMRLGAIRFSGQLKPAGLHAEENPAARGPRFQCCQGIADGKEVSGARLARKANCRRILPSRTVSTVLLYPFIGGTKKKQTGNDF